MPEHSYIPAPGTENQAWGPLVCELCGISAEKNYTQDELEAYAVTHEQLELESDTLYDTGEGVYYSPDGVGKVWFDSIYEAAVETGIERVVFL